VSVPFVIKGVTRQGATVRITVQVTSGFLNAQIGDVYAVLDGAGGFRYLVDPAIKPAGATFTITVNAQAGQESNMTTLTVQQKP
jgi:hypothetical protein